MNTITSLSAQKSHRCWYFVPLFYPAVMMFEEVHMPLTLWRQKTFSSYLTEMHLNRCFVRQVKRHASLPTVRNQTDIIMWRACEKLQDLAFDRRIIYHNNALGSDAATTATPCRQNSALRAKQALCGTNWMSNSLARLPSVNVTCGSLIVITPWYQTGNNNTNKTNC